MKNILKWSTIIVSTTISIYLIRKHELRMQKRMEVEKFDQIKNILMKGAEHDKSEKQN